MRSVALGDDQHFQRARAMHAFDAIQFDIGSRRGAGDKGDGTPGAHCGFQLGAGFGGFDLG